MPPARSCKRQNKPNHEPNRRLHPFGCGIRDIEKQMRFVVHNFCRTGLSKSELWKYTYENPQDRQAHIICNAAPATAAMTNHQDPSLMFRLLETALLWLALGEGALLLAVLPLVLLEA